MASGRGVIFQQGAFALGVGLLLDAVVVRLILLPATLALLGRSAWRVPSWLDVSGQPPATTSDAWTRDWSGWPVGARR